MYGYTQQTTVAFVPPAAFVSSWYYFIYQQIQQHELYEMQAWFYSVDMDRSGSISSAELQYLRLSPTVAPIGIEIAKKLISVFDQNRNGQIDFYEYAALHQFMKVLNRSFIQCDRNRSGTIDAHEIHSALIASGFNFVQFHTVNALFLKLSPAGYGLNYNQFLNLGATIALTRSLFEWNSRGSGVAQLNLGQLLDIVSLV